MCNPLTSQSWHRCLDEGWTPDTESQGANLLTDCWPIRFSFEKLFLCCLNRLYFAWGTYSGFLLLLNQNLWWDHCSSQVSTNFSPSHSLLHFSKKIEAFLPEVLQFSSNHFNCISRWFSLVSERLLPGLFLKIQLESLSTLIKTEFCDFILCLLFTMLFIFFCFHAFLLYELVEFFLYLFFFCSFGTYTYCCFFWMNFPRLNICTQIYIFPSKLKVNQYLHHSPPPRSFNFHLSKLPLILY